MRRQFLLCALVLEAIPSSIAATKSRHASDPLDAENWRKIQNLNASLAFPVLHHFSRVLVSK
ncbi:unnamed protein product [Albugo candida]|uniref:RxLR effector protein n=1 Tax=Albugo candida TaxID=65357 RepID=A0A024GGT9_9STRA|nr:unnamed protein product [Albugo candida]|eukprot:CCI45964.1 unnamed protein product [Albugo candida]